VGITDGFNTASGNQGGSGEDGEKFHLHI